MADVVNDRYQNAVAIDSAMITERSYWEPDWTILAKVFLSRRSRFLDKDAATTRDGRLQLDILDGTGVRAIKTLAAGMHGGMTSPVRKWFSLTLADPELARAPKVRAWLDEVEIRMADMFHRSNFYGQIHLMYKALGVFGTSFMFVLPDDRTGIRFECVPVGAFCLDVDDAGRVDTVSRTEQMTARNIVKRYGIENVSEAVKKAYEHASSQNSAFNVKHMIIPNAYRDPLKLNNQNMPWASYHWEANQTEKKFLKVSGFRTLPGYGVRWDVEGGDVYGCSPAMDCLGDTRMLQSLRATYLKQEHKKADPPLAHPSNVVPSTIPGGLTAVNEAGGGQSIYPIQQVSPDTRGILEITQDTRNAIREGLFNDLFKMMALSDWTQKTATEIVERHEEKLILLGPVLERLNDEAFIPNIDRTFGLMVESDLIPPPPEEALTVPLKVEFESLLAQAQRMVKTAAVDQFMGFVSSYAPVFPEFLDIPNPDNMGNKMAEYLGIETKLLRDQSVRDISRQQRAQAAQARETAELAGSAAGTAKTMAETPLKDGSTQALDALLGGLGTL